MHHRLRTVAVAALLCALGAFATPSAADVLEYSGRGTVLGGNILAVPINVVDTGPLPPAGGNLTAGLPNFNLLGLVSADVLQANAVGVPNQSNADATISNLVLTVGLITITADVISSEAEAVCTGDVASASASSVVTALTVNGMSIVVSGAPNQVVALPLGLGQITINEQSSVVAGNMADITVTALHVEILPLIGATTDLFISRSHADVECGFVATTSTSTSSTSSSSSTSSTSSTTSTSDTTSSSSTSSTSSTSTSVVTSTQPTSSSSTTSTSATTTSSTSTSTSTTSTSSTTSTTVPIPADHYKCYKTRGARLTRRQVTLADQFLTETVTVKRPYRLCNPGNKNGEGILDPTSHLMCYKISAQTFTPRTVLAQNQFGDNYLRILRPESLCNPAAKNVIQSDLPINHYKCYRARSLNRFQPRVVTVQDQFETRTGTLIKPVSFCNPVDKNGEGILNPSAHQTCYKFQADGSPFAGPSVNVLDQFGAIDLRAVSGVCRKADILCVPSLKTEL